MKNLTVAAGVFAFLVVPLIVVSFLSSAYFVFQDPERITLNLQSGMVWKYTLPLFSALAAVIIADVWVLASYYTAAQEVESLTDGLYTSEKADSSNIYTLAYLSEPKNPFTVVIGNYVVSAFLFVLIIVSAFLVTNVIGTPGALFSILFFSFLLSVMDLALKFYLFYLRYSYYVTFIFDYGTSTLQVFKTRLMFMQSLKEFTFDEINGFSLDTVYLQVPVLNRVFERGFDFYINVAKERIELFYVSKYKFEAFLSFMKRLKEDNPAVVSKLSDAAVQINPGDK